MIARLFALLFTNSSPLQTLIKNTGWLLGAEAVAKGGVFLITLVLARFFGPEQFGALSYLLSIATLCAILTDYGLTNLVVKEASKHPEHTASYFFHGAILKSIFGVITLLAVAGISTFITSHISPTLLLLCCGYMILSNVTDFLRAWFRPLELMQHEAGLKISSGVLLVGITLMTLVVRRSLEAVVRGFVLATLIALAITCGYLRWYHALPRQSFSIDRKLLLSLLRKGAPLALSLCCVTIYINGDQVLLGYFGLTHDLGIYALGYKMTFLYTVIFGMLYQSILPRLAKQPSEERYRLGIKWITKINLGMLLVYGSIAYRLSVQTVRDLGAYQASLVVFLWLLVYCVCESYGQRMYLNLLALGKEINIVQLLGTCALVNIIGNLILIPVYSYRGAIAMTIVTYLLLRACGAWFVHKAFDDTKKSSDALVL